jgi:hypothetical protein
MKIFVAVNKGFKKEKGEILECRENEPVMFGWDSDLKTMVGLDTYKSTTAFRVRESNLTPTQMRDKFLRIEKKKGWAGISKESDIKSQIREEVDVLLLLADEHPTGAVLRRRRGKIMRRI